MSSRCYINLIYKAWSLIFWSLLYFKTPLELRPYTNWLVLILNNLHKLKILCLLNEKPLNITEKFSLTLKNNNKYGKIFEHSSINFIMMVYQCLPWRNGSTIRSGSLFRKSSRLVSDSGSKYWFESCLIALAFILVC